MTPQPDPADGHTHANTNANEEEKLETTNLFSHPYEPETPASRDDSNEPTEMPAFSDRSRKD
jgi:hypothetical protein